SVVRFQNGAGPQLPDLDNTLQAATSGTTNPVGFDVVLIRTITDQNGAASNILGIAGGIPASPVLGTPHSGVVVSIESMCANRGGSSALLGTTMGHELGHSVGLFHSQEQDGNTDPLTDTAVDGQTNLMYWLESSGQHLSVQQGQVIRDDPKVK
ncbi:MAG TPA: hypothetical protein VFF06_08175, partial [Polyangia bacterium]|nr:hypothetical protein [Polyangia bacterium]